MTRMDSPLAALARTDPEVFGWMHKELGRQEEGLELIASENFVSPAVLAAVGSHLTNKYAEGYPGKRYYGGCQYYDEIEALAIARAKSLFGADHANVQPHSGATANFSAYHAAIEPGDRIMAMSLDDGGHLTHGSSVNFSGRFFDVVPYGVTSDGLLDYDAIVALAREKKPKLIVAGASAYPRTIDFSRFREAADTCGAKLMVDMAHIAGLVAAGCHPSPVEFADYITTTTHKTLRGPRGGLILCKEKRRKKLDSRVFPGTQGGPLMHVVAAKAVCFLEAHSAAFRELQQRTVSNAKALAQGLMARGLKLVSDGTDNHLMLLDLRDHVLNGAEAEKVLDSVDITVNKNKVPNDPESPMVTSGIRIGTPAMTTRGLQPADMDEVADIISTVLSSASDEKEKASARERVHSLSSKYPLYPEQAASYDAVAREAGDA